MATKILKLTGKILLIALCSVLALVLLFLGTLNIAKFAIYPDYYAIQSNICKNPGLSDGFVCQGVSAYEEGGKFFVTGYMKDHSASRIYVTDKDNNSYYVTVTLENGKAYTGHGCGIVFKGDTAYLVSEAKIHILSLSEILGAENGASIPVSETIAINNSGSFVYTDDDYLYIGEFHNGNQYVTDHPYETPDGMQYAIMCRYSFDDLTKPDKVYSITNQVQGACVTPDGEEFTVRAAWEGRILHGEEGDGGFGYDPLFYVEEYGKTLASVTPEEKNAISHRGKALRAFVAEYQKRRTAK